MGVTNKKIAVLGFAFKKDTGDVRETPAIDVCNMLLQDGAIVNVYDPKVKKEDALTEFKYHNMQVDESRLIFRSRPRRRWTGHMPSSSSPSGTSSRHSPTTSSMPP